MAIDRTFFKALFDPPDLVEARAIGGGRPHQAYAMAMGFDSLDDELRRRNDAGANIYFGANPRQTPGGSAKHVSTARCVFVDIDHVEPNEGRQRIKDAGMPKPTATVASGHGVHAWWRLTNPMTNLAAWSAMQKRAAAAVGGDEVFDSPRVMRLPGFTNHKPPIAQSRLLDVAPDRRYDVDRIADCFPAAASDSFDAELADSSDSDSPDVAARRKPEAADIRFGADDSRALNHRLASDVSGVSVTLPPELSVTPESVIERTLPRGLGERNTKLLELARGLKFDAGLAHASLAVRRGHVREWHTRALPVIGTQPFDATWADFIHAFKRAHTPLSAKPHVVAFAQAEALLRDGTPPTAALAYDSHEVRLIVCACMYLSAMNDGGVFFLSMNNAGQLAGVHQQQACRYLKMLVDDGVLELVRTGDTRRANRYRYIGN